MERPSPASPSERLTVIEPRRGWSSLDLQALWAYRELLYFLVWRDIRVRYKQTVLGVAWAVLQPMLTMTVFVVIFGRFAGFPSDGVPYPLFAFSAILVWTYFAQATAGAAQSLVGEAALLKKVYLPRLLVPLAAVVRPGVDFAVSFVLLVAMAAWYGVSPSWRMLVAPLILLTALVVSLSAGLWLAALNVRYRDIGHTFPFLIQIWMFVSPVAYSTSLVPEPWRFLYSLNPLVGLIEGFRWAMLGTPAPRADALAVATVATMLTLAGGVVYFRSMERSFADIV